MLIFLVFAFLFGCKKKNESVSLSSIYEINNLNIAEYVIVSVSEIKFPKSFGENRFLIEVKGKVRFCVDLSKIKFKNEKKYVIFYEIPKPKLCNYDITDSIIQYDEDINLFYIPFSHSDMKLAFKIAIDSLRGKIEKLSEDSIVQSQMERELKIFLSAFVRNFSKEARFE